ncbi:MAG TPA: ATP-binding protein [Actinophytocola sp.]|uniref:HAMP domain-containing sensor histidine kinase n=1 Tax=Actinophytocola sp. TaxID=1872138 RepID=UPI002DFF8C07|nr:ATP-binding protein [Actinophytocola sp.]
MKRWGLRGRMTASYLLVTAAAVLLVEIVVALLISPALEAPPEAGASAVVQRTALEYATVAGNLYARLEHLPSDKEIQLGEQGPDVPAGGAQVRDNGVRIPFISTAQDDSRPVSLALLLDPELTIVASSYPARYPVGGRVGTPGVGALPVDAILKFADGGAPADGQVKMSNGEVLMAVAPVFSFTIKPGLLDKGAGKPIPRQGSIGTVYVQAPLTPELMAAAKDVAPSKSDYPWDSLMSQLAGGVLVLIGALPVGVVFGLLSARPLIRRLRRLATSTVAVADGQYQHRVPVSGSDEITQLETSFNRMAARLADAMTAERHLASAGERARIARELHDSISQDLFSLRLLAGGLRRALPADSPLYSQVEAMERTATGTMHEMQALLLELRPVALQDAGLNAAIEELCQAYRDRLGVAVIAELAQVELDSAAEHAVLRVVQEALANAVKHARPNRITVMLDGDEEHVTVSVTDDGNGFDPERAAERHGMGLSLMRERAAELGGEFRVDSTPGRGTTVHIRLPRRRP